MNLSIIIAGLFLLSQFHHINGEYSMDRPLLRVRNQYLRFYVYSKKDKLPLKSRILEASTTIKDGTTRIYNSILSKYYEAHIAYYNLPPEDIELIDQIINLHF